MKLEQEDFNYGHKLIDYIIDHVNIEDIEKNITESVNENYPMTDYYKFSEFIIHINALFLNVELNQLSFRYEGAKEKSIESRRVCHELLKTKYPISSDVKPIKQPVKPELEIKNK